MPHLTERMPWSRAVTMTIAVAVPVAAAVTVAMLKVPWALARAWAAHVPAVPPRCDSMACILPNKRWDAPVAAIVGLPSALAVEHADAEGPKLVAQPVRRAEIAHRARAFALVQHALDLIAGRAYAHRRPPLAPLALRATARPGQIVGRHTARA